VRVGRMRWDVDSPIVMPGDGIGRHNADMPPPFRSFTQRRCALFEGSAIMDCVTCRYAAAMFLAASV
jgi:hypothetical protein